MKGEAIPIVARAGQFADRRAIVAGDANLNYGQLLEKSARGAGVLLGDQKDLNEARVAFLMPAGAGYVVTQWSVWRAGGVAVPLCTGHPARELAYVIEDSQASIVVGHESFAGVLKPIVAGRGLKWVGLEELMEGGELGELPSVGSDRRAMILYTSGTTSKPKGVVTTHEMLAAQIKSLVQAWEWTKEDHVLHVLPLHHLHGILNVLCCAMWAGATCEMMAKFDADAVWQRIVRGDGLTLFMAVPTIYARLVAAWEGADLSMRKRMTEGCKRLRLMVSGSAALPVATLEKWREISGHTLLERFGMTEIGMGLSNPLHGIRRPGCVGSPLPFVEARLVDEAGGVIGDGLAGQIQVKGPTVFTEYWNRPQATKEAFTIDGWFKTGDIAVREKDVYRILGRESIDIIKTGGYKVSALEIEEVLRTHEAIGDCAVVGVEDAEWGQRVGAAVVLKEKAGLDLETLRSWGKGQLAIYKVPTLLVVLGDLPRNAMGKVVKPEVVKLFGGGAMVGKA